MILWFRTTRSLRADLEWQRAYSQVTGGKIVAEIREIMGQDEDKSDHRTTAEGEFEKSWTFEESGVRITVVFNQKGQSIYKEFGPSFCGVTPLMGKLLPKKIDDAD